ncbi:MAG: uracil-DNA glycosylase [Cytophagales bacterium]|nr:uracil-DNA glycosylase [Cytophagales bacterium]
MEVDIESSWADVLGGEFGKPYFEELVNFLRTEYKEYRVYPRGKNIFRAFALTPFHAVRVVILGQDPYHGPNQAHGLAFSVPEGERIPPSLENIFKELHQDLGRVIPSSGDLSSWASRGVLLLNSMLSVRAGQPGSHQGRGWETFTDRVIGILNELREGLVFILWGSYARAKSGLIDGAKHLVLTSAHPSPFSADRGFFGSSPFSRVNDYLGEEIF